jgi:hypothetical protein
VYVCVRHNVALTVRARDKEKRETLSAVLQRDILAKFFLVMQHIIWARNLHDQAKTRRMCQLVTVGNMPAALKSSSSMLETIELRALHKSLETVLARLLQGRLISAVRFRHLFTSSTGKVVGWVHGVRGAGRDLDTAGILTGVGDLRI